jgi:hypothetical protein
MFTKLDLFKKKTVLQKCTQVAHYVQNKLK